MISASIVVYKTPYEILSRAIQSLQSSPLSVQIYIIDNSPTDELKTVLSDCGIEYFFTGKNLGYGGAHNIAIQKSMEREMKYHVVMNPDVAFDGDAIQILYEFMEQNQNAGLVMPQVRFPNGDLQYLCKKQPRPFDLITRRFLPGFLKSFLFHQRLISYEFRDRDYNSIMEVPNLSGCFMFLRNSMLQNVGGFDERFFLYCEDTDLSLRIHKKYQTFYNPKAFITHYYQKKSYSDLRHLCYHVVSAVKFFNKWGWRPFF